MKYPELCKALERKLGVATVYFDRFPYLGSRGSDKALLLRFDEGQYKVEHFESDRGTISLWGTFGTEEEACDYIYDRLTWVAPPPVKQTAEERRRSREISSAFNQQLKEMFRECDNGVE